MKRLFLIAIGMIVTLTGSLAADFQPTIMKLTCPSEIEYHFNDKPLTIPFTISGTPGAVWLVINTHGQAENIIDVRNGYLGWHYVNKIDTTVYVSQRFERDIGETEIIWDGKNQDGNPVEPGTYDYYLWAYDDKSERQLASKDVVIGYLYGAQYAHIYELGEESLPLARPLIIGSVSPYVGFWDKYGTHFKWALGSDPNDSSMLQTTMCSTNYWTSDNLDIDFVMYGGSVFNPNNYSIFYHTSIKNVVEEGFYKRYSTIFKWEFVTDGEAILDNEWLGWDEIIFEEKLGLYADKLSTCYTDRNYIYIAVPVGWSTNQEWNKLRCISFDGEVLFDKMMHDWYMPDQQYLGGYVNGSIDKLYSRGNNKWFLLGSYCCMHQMIDTSRLIVDPYDETDMVVFENRNGDYFLDNCWQENIEPAWICIPGIGSTNTVSSFPYSVIRDAICIDSNNFNIIFLSWFGLTSFGVSTQDGTGIGYMSFADDTNDKFYEENYKGGGQLCDSGSNYDGLYINGINTSDYQTKKETYFVAFDSAHGVVTNTVSVEDENQVTFSVEQNTPNPFNPYTTIEFTLPESNHVTIDIYNIAGQKVETLANDFMEVGKHTVTWGASGFSAGLYFCTVRSGVYEKTVKMTLLK